VKRCARLLAAVMAALALQGTAARAQEGAEPSRSGSIASKIGGAPDLSAFEGKPISGVQVVLDDDTWDDIPLRKVGSVKDGEPFSPAVARRALEEVLSVGLFGRGRVSVLADGARVKLVVHVVPRKLVQSMHLDMHGARVDREEVLHAAGLSVGGEIIGRDLPDAKTRVLAVLRQHGYPSATIDFTLRETDDPAEVVVLVDLEPGTEARVSRRFFYVFGVPEAEVEPITGTYSVGKGDRLDDSVLTAADTQLGSRLRAKGYHHAVVSHDIVTDAAGATLRVRVDTGPRFSTRYDGNVTFDADALDGALALGDEVDRSAGHLVSKLRTFYMARGFLDVDITLEARGQDVPNPRQVYLVFHIREEPRAFVVSRAYPCLKPEMLKGLKGDAPRTPKAIGDVIDAFLEDELPGADYVVNPNPETLESVLSGDQGLARGERAAPIDLDPDAAFVPDTYERAVAHVQELLRNEGFLHAEVGPVVVVRRRCDPRSPPGVCRPLRSPHAPSDACTYDATNLPVAETARDPELTCVPDRAHGITCEPQLLLRIPVKLGPHTTLYDLGFRGVRSISEKRLAEAAKLVLGAEVSSLSLEEARRRVLDMYREEGFAYADVKVTLDESLDHTRGRATFEVVEGDRVIVDKIIIRGNDVTADGVIRRRIALAVGQPYRTSLARRTQQQVSTLNVFSTVNVALENAYLPQPHKTVVVSVVEQPSQYVETRLGLSSGEGIRVNLEYGDRNILGNAIGFAFHAQLSYLPDFLILDPQVKANFDTLGNPGFGQRLAGRLTGTFTFPDIGLGPLIRASTDAIGVRDLERDFHLTKAAIVWNGYYRPFRQLQFALSPDVEFNDVGLFQAESLAAYIASQGGGTELSTLLRVPQGTSYAVAQRFIVTWDRRDDAFNAHRGTLLTSGVEHIDWNALSVCTNGACSGHSFRFTETFAGYIPITKTIRLAGEIRLGLNVQTTGGSTTYPDRLFFMGGEDSIRGWLQDTFVPQDYADRIAQSQNPIQISARRIGAKGVPWGTLPTAGINPLFTINDVALRGGNLMVNPRLELRIPIKAPLETVLFGDAGNLWSDPRYPFEHLDSFSLRYSAGTGIRLQTPIGPIAVDYGVNLSRLFSATSNVERTYEDPWEFHFAIGLF